MAKQRSLLTSHHVNYMIYRYLQETGFAHSAFTFANESRVVQHVPVDPNSVPPGSLIALLQKGLQFLELEANLDGQDGDVDGEFSMLTPEELLTHDVDQLRALVSERREETRGRGERVERKRQTKPAANKDKAQQADKDKSGADVAPAAAAGNAVGGRADDGGPAPMDEEPATSANIELPASAVTTLSGHTAEVYMCAWHPSEPVVASGAGDSTARIWDLSRTGSQPTPPPMCVLKHEQKGERKDVTVLEWHPEGHSLATGGYDGSVRVWSQEGKLKQSLETHTGPVFALRWNRRGDLLLSGSMDRQLVVWDRKTGDVKQSWAVHTAAALDVDWRTHTSFASCSSDRTIHVLRVGEAEPLRTWTGHTDEVNAIRWDPSGALLASCSDDCTVRIWGHKSDTCLHTFTDHRKEIYTVRWSPTGPGSPNPSMNPVLGTASFDHTVRLWDVGAAKCTLTLQGHTGMVYSLAFSPNGKYVATGSFDHSILVWSVADGSLVRSYHGDSGVYEVCWDASGDRLAGCFVANAVRVLDMRM